MMIVSDKILRSTIKFLISSTITHVNSLNIEDKEMCINIQFNMIMNILQPQYAKMFLDELLNYSGNLELLRALDREDTVNEILENMTKI